MSEMITVPEAAELLGCGVTTVHWLADRGSLEILIPPHTGSKPRRSFVRKADVERLKSEGWRRYKERGK